MNVYKTVLLLKIPIFSSSHNSYYYSINIEGLKVTYQFDWKSAFEAARQGRRTILDEHIDEAREAVLLPMLRAKTRSLHDAEEVMSLVITKFWERFYVKEETLPDNVNGYLYTMANNAFFHYSKKQDKKKKQFVNLDIGEMNRVFEERGGNESAFGNHNKHQEKERLLTALESSFKELGEKCRKLLTLFIYEKKRMKDIYQLLGIPTANAATKKKESCINNLRKLMYKEIHHFKQEGYV